MVASAAGNCALSSAPPAAIAPASSASRRWHHTTGPLVSTEPGELHISMVFVLAGYDCSAPRSSRMVGLQRKVQAARDGGTGAQIA